MKLFSKKSVCQFLTLAMCIVGIQTVHAAEIYYTNQYGVTFTKEQYDFFSAMYNEGYQERITPEVFGMFEEEVMKPELVESKTYIEYLPYSTLATSVSSSFKTLKISRAVGTRCSVSVSVDWKVSPSTRSYDVIGAYLPNSTLIGTPYTATYAGNSSTNETDIKKTSTGFGVSFKLPSQDYIKITQTYNTTTGGRVYASYQHATDNVSLETSKNYTIAYAGLGNVFDFFTVARSHYDAMSGVYIDC